MLRDPRIDARIGIRTSLRCSVLARFKLAVAASVTAVAALSNKAVSATLDHIVHTHSLLGEKRASSSTNLDARGFRLNGLFHKPLQTAVQELVSLLGLKIPFCLSQLSGDGFCACRKALGTRG